MVNPSFFCVVSETIFLSGKIFQIRYTPIAFSVFMANIMCAEIVPPLNARLKHRHITLILHMWGV